MFAYIVVLVVGVLIGMAGMWFLIKKGQVKP